MPQAGRNASLFHKFVTAARDCTEGMIDPLDSDNEENLAKNRGERSKNDTSNGEEGHGSGATVASDEFPKHDTKPSRRAKRSRDPVMPRVSERQIMERLEEKNWRTEGHELIGQRVRRYLGGDRVANGHIVQWLPAGRDSVQMPLLFRIQHDRTRSKEDVSEIEGKLEMKYATLPCLLASYP